jgi:protein-tyrosine-phosphatase
MVRGTYSARAFGYPIAAFVLAVYTPFAEAQDKKTLHEGSTNTLVVALQYSHLNASPDVLGLGSDKALKSALTLALRDKTGFSPTVGDETDRRILKAVVGNQFATTREAMERAVRDKTPTSRSQLNEKTRRHADLLTTQFDMVDGRYHDAAGDLATWIAKNYQPGKSLGVVVVCTGNSRRSILGATMGNVAAAYYGMTDLRFHSGGTKPSAFNSRTVTTLREIGVEIETTGKEAPRGEGGEANPIYCVRWGKNLEATEFSKRYSDEHNPQSGFAAVLVCSEADESCPTVRGAGKRIAVPYQDPKAYDGAEFEAAKYAERRDDIGRFMLSVVMQARRITEVENHAK